jgi:hypothetical protein
MNSDRIIKIDEIKKIIEEVSDACGKKLIYRKDYEIKDRGFLNHTRPSEKNENVNFGACYIFDIDKMSRNIKNEYGIIKIGKVSKGGKARFFSNHYYYTPAGSQSTICKSMCDSEEFPEITKNISPEERAKKIVEITGRIDIILKTENPYANTLIEAALIYKFNPEFEKTCK